MKVGAKIKFTHGHLFQTVTYTARVVKLQTATGWVEIPEKVRKLPFPPYGGKRYVLFPIEVLEKREVKP